MCCAVLSFLYVCPTLYDPMHCSPPESSIHGILQARILEWVPIPFYQEIFRTQGLNLHPECLLHCRKTLYHWANRETHNNPYQQLITWNQNGHIKESNLIVKYSLGRILGKCTWSLLESVFNWVVSVAHKFIFFQKTAREVVSLYLSHSFSQKKKKANRIKWFVHNKYALPWTVYYIES